MANLSTAEANRLLDASLPTGGTTYVALFTVAPNAAGTGGTEVSGGSYARQAFPTTAASGGSKTNNAEIAFPTATADWGTIVAYAIYDAASAGTMRWFKTLSGSEQKTIATNDQYKIATGAAGITATLS